jgi:hypothetical protein
MKYILCLFICCVFFISGCSSNNSNQSQVLVLPYSAFGPPSMSGSLLGVEWFQWQSHGDSRPRKYDVNIVVYRDSSFEEVKSQYPISEKNEIDYRYVTYVDSITYFDENISNVVIMEQEGYPMGTLPDRLKATKAQIIDKLGD